MNRRTLIQAPILRRRRERRSHIRRSCRRALPNELLPNRPHDFDFLVGSWRVAHRRLKERLAGNDQWEEFDGTSTLWLTMGGFGTFDDNVINLPAGTYRGCRATHLSGGELPCLDDCAAMIQRRNFGRSGGWTRARRRARSIRRCADAL